MYKQKSYEVIKFIEHGAKCRIVMDCSAGSLLIYRLKNPGTIKKETVFNWFKMLAFELEKYHRCNNDRCYRFLNPYSILVTPEDKIMLLDLNAQSNVFVMKNMQRPAMREHFVKPVIHVRENTRLFLDIYGLGRTMQYILAYTEPVILLTKREVYILSGIIEKCLGGNPRKKYDSLKQVQKDLPRPNTRKKIFQFK